MAHRPALGITVLRFGWRGISKDCPSAVWILWFAKQKFLHLEFWILCLLFKLSKYTEVFSLSIIYSTAAKHGGSYRNQSEWLAKESDDFFRVNSVLGCASGSYLLVWWFYKWGCEEMLRKTKVLIVLQMPPRCAHTFWWLSKCHSSGYFSPSGWIDGTVGRGQGVIEDLVKDWKEVIPPCCWCWGGGVAQLLLRYWELCDQTF